MSTKFDKLIDVISNYLSKTPIHILFVYFLFSIFLSILIFFRIWTLPADLVKPINFANLVIYSGNYYFLPLIATFWLLIYSMSNFNLSKLKILGIFGLFFALICVVFLLPGYAFSWIPIFLMALFNRRWNKTKSRLSSKKVIAAILLVAVLMPNASAFVHYNSVLREALPIAHENDKAIFISSHINKVTTFTPIFRAYNDWWAFLLSSAGQCGEMATATIAYLNQLGFNARKISLPGENHEFVEVKINDTWYVLDPGYYPSEKLTRQERATRRVSSTDIGAIKTDNIVIRILNSGEPLANAKVYLIHKFMNSNTRLPDAASFYLTDNNGTVTLKMGALNYSDEAKEFEPFYWIYVNDENTGYTITSNGTGAIDYKEIDLADLP
jgi:hypothetical protein